MPSAQISAPATAYPTPSSDACPLNAPALTTTIPAKPSSSPAIFEPVNDSPSSGAASTPTSTGWR